MEMMVKRKKSVRCNKRSFLRNLVGGGHYFFILLKGFYKKIEKPWYSCLSKFRKLVSKNSLCHSFLDVFYVEKYKYLCNFLFLYFLKLSFTTKIIKCFIIHHTILIKNYHILKLILYLNVSKIILQYFFLKFCVKLLFLTKNFWITVHKIIEF